MIVSGRFQRSREQYRLILQGQRQNHHPVKVIAVSHGKRRQLREKFWGKWNKFGRRARASSTQGSSVQRTTSLHGIKLQCAEFERGPVQCSSEMNQCTLPSNPLPTSRLPHSIQGSSVQGTARDLQCTILPPIHRKSTFLPEQPVLLHKICSNTFQCNQICKISLLRNPM